MKHTKTILTILFLAFAQFASAQKEPIISYEWLEEKSKIISDLQYKANGQEIDFGDNRIVNANYTKNNFSVNFSDKIASVSVNFKHKDGGKGLIIVENMDLTRVANLIENDGEGVILMFPSVELEWQLYTDNQPIVEKDKIFYFKAANETDSKKMFSTFWDIINRLKVYKGLISESEVEQQWKDWQNLAIEDFYIKYPKSILAHEFNDKAFAKVGGKYYDEKKYTEALKWYERASSLGNGFSSYMAGHLYFSGKGVQKDYEKAISYFIKGAEQGDLNAIITAGLSYRFGWGTKKNEIIAREFYQKAIDLGSIEALVEMGDSYNHRTNPNEVIDFYQKYIYKGGKLSAKQKVYLGNAYYEVERYKAALAYLQEAYSEGECDKYDGRDNLM